MLSVLLNLITITIVSLFFIFVLSVLRRKSSEPNVSASDVMDELIYGDRLAEVRNESAIRLMNGPFSVVDGYEDVRKSISYLVT